jgi:NhaA family Na+:H+ antiporter
MATDIAFALAVLALLGNRVPAELRAVLLAYATVDDLGAILVIAVFYSHGVSWPALGAAALLLAAVYGLVRVRMAAVVIYITLGALVWLAVHESGVHATVAGVLLGFLAPIRPWFGRGEYGRRAEGYLRHYREAVAAGDDDQADAVLGRMEELTVGTESSLDRWDRLTRPWVSYAVLPLFALANAGVVLTADGLRAAVADSVTWGIALGLFVGKAAGILGGVWLAVRTGLAERPKEMTWGVLAGLGLLGGIGFTVALFITELAFEPGQIPAAKVAILVTSVAAGLAGYAVLRVMLPRSEGESSSPR